MMICVYLVLILSNIKTNRGDVLGESVHSFNQPDS